jgi:hypothetical protein
VLHQGRRKPRLREPGFDETSGNYAATLQVDIPVIAAKALGATLLGLGLTINTPVPDIELLKDLGN